MSDKPEKNLKDLQPAIKAKNFELAKQAQAILKTEAKSLFKTYPDIAALRWTQRRSLDAPDFVPVRKSDFSIDNVEYRLKDSFDDFWFSPWDSRLENSDFLDSLTLFERKLFDAEAALAVAIGEYDRVTVTPTDVLLEQL